MAASLPPGDAHRGLARVRAVHVPVAGHLAEPAVLAARQDVEAADRALAAVLIAVEDVDRERSAVGQGPDEAVALGVVVIADGALPETGLGRRNVRSTVRRRRASGSACGSRTKPVGQRSRRPVPRGPPGRRRGGRRAGPTRRPCGPGRPAGTARGGGACRSAAPARRCGPSDWTSARPRTWPRRARACLRPLRGRRSSPSRRPPESSHSARGRRLRSPPALDPTPPALTHRRGTGGLIDHE